MSDRITPAQFHDAAGTEDWQAPEDGPATATFRTGAFTTGVRLVEEIGELAEAADHHPDVDLRYATVVVRTMSHDIGGLSDRDAALAARISEAARELDIPADRPSSG
ncbi:4a-hydroxytetrahydrobiopterin dehydratase [Isoptericola sp. 178]|uniref:4a-hydroxytetrahydrobiopterin dehydratase n=1 Tax=Isoptericola sp. 178 TaxID=3064651 RepID=UPI002713D144|nr:4a-hydroxytetrahydrobiopterin dehydratase [Isoptericola sp. 178]MDO8145523.1 4a-hydroxytetrahydrobiopterin dehydratase [Isoptericola sp. 178]